MDNESQAIDQAHLTWPIDWLRKNAKDSRMTRVVVLTAVYIVITGGILFGAAGRLDWAMGWTFLCIWTAATVTILVFADREMLLVRAGKEKGAKKWDLFLAGLSFLLFWPGSNIVAGLDYGRFHWSPPVPLPIQLMGLLLFVLGVGFGAWAMVTNRFFGKPAGIQMEREHAVITNGPYAYVRHPGYAGNMLAFITLPVALGSLWALLPALAGLALLAARTFLEDRTLHKELDGYAEYASRVRWRLIPGIW